jgi:8-oxo-dGTP diphosphatase
VIDVVCGVIEDSEGRYLACLRPEGRHLGGLWEFPGGKVEPGEAPDAALARELEEELGIRVEVGAALRPVEWHYERASIRLLPFRCRIVEGIPHPHEHERVMWCAPEDFGALKWADADVPVLGELRAESGDPGPA